MVEYAAMSRSELRGISREASDELARRQTMETFFVHLAELQEQYVEAFGGHEEGETWAECDNPLDAYSVNDTVTFSGVKHRSNIPCNQFKPGVRGWRKLGDPNPWLEPKADHDAYMAGEVVRLSGAVWEATEDYVMSRPSVKSEGWEMLRKEGDPEPEVGDE